MARRVTIVCDVCGKADETCQRFTVEIASRSKWSGDICPDCQIRLAKEFPGEPESMPVKRGGIFDKVVDLDAHRTDEKGTLSD